MRKPREGMSILMSFEEGAEGLRKPREGMTMLMLFEEGAEGLRRALLRA